MEVIVDFDAMLRIMFTAHDRFEVTVYEVSVLPTLHLDLPLGGVLQSLLHARSSAICRASCMCK